MKRYQHLEPQDGGGHTRRVATAHLMQLEGRSSQDGLAKSAVPVSELPSLLSAGHPPVIIAGRWRLDDDPRLDGRLTLGSTRRQWTLVVLYHDKDRQRLRCLGGLGTAWGQSGRCWLDLSLLQQMTRVVNVYQFPEPVSTETRIENVGLDAQQEASTGDHKEDHKEVGTEVGTEIGTEAS